MNRIILVLICIIASTPGLATEVGVSITVGQPGFYGRIDIGNYPQPRVIYPQPVIIEYVQVPPQAIYLRVPPGHARHWDKHCHEYQACGQRVYFVEDDWYEEVYVPAYQEQHGNKNKNKNANKHKNKDQH